MTSETSKAIQLTDRFDQAFLYASQLHRSQRRKGCDIPYISHLMSVAALVIEDGGDEDEAIAALLHDSAEDQGGEATLEEVRARFGDNVASIVAECSDTFETPKPPWHERKWKYIEHLRSHASRGARRVSLADKLHNARTILLDYRGCGEGLWGRFTATREDTLWYYREIAGVYRATTNSPMAEELVRVVEELAAIIERAPGT